MSPKETFALIKKCILAIQEKKEKPTRVAINGIEGTGKTVFAEKLAEYLNAENSKAIHVSIDGFHFDKELRYKQGRDSAAGYYEDSYDEIAFVEKVLKSSQSEKPHYTAATHDLKTDEYLRLAPVEIDHKVILITDGAYLFKPNYRKHWDLKIFLKTSFEIAMARGIERDLNLLGGFAMARKKYETRYHQASRRYITENSPEHLADLIIENSNFENLEIVKNAFAKKT